MSTTWVLAAIWAAGAAVFAIVLGKALERGRLERDPLSAAAFVTFVAAWPLCVLTILLAWIFKVWRR